MNFPHHLAYFSELVGGPSRGRRILGDSNLDWGQALPDLRDFVRKNPGGVILSYFGMDCPPAYGLDLQEAFSTPQACSGSRRALPVELGAEWLAVGATKWQGFYEKGVPAFSWLRSRAPRDVLGNSLLVYDVSRDPDAHLELASMYERAGLPELAVEKSPRALDLKPMIKTIFLSLVLAGNFGVWNFLARNPGSVDARSIRILFVRGLLPCAAVLVFLFLCWGAGRRLLRLFVLRRLSSPLSQLLAAGFGLGIAAAGIFIFVIIGALNTWGISVLLTLLALSGVPDNRRPFDPGAQTAPKTAEPA